MIFVASRRPESEYNAVGTAAGVPAISTGGSIVTIGPLKKTAIAAVYAALAATAAAGDKIVVDKADDLPRHTYHIDGTGFQML